MSDTKRRTTTFASSQRGDSKPIDHLERIGQFYDQAWFDYRLFWADLRSLAFHLGYWQESTRNHADSLIEMNQAMASRIGVTRGDLILDVGCGVGGTALWLAETFNVQVVGVNIACGQIDRARRYARERALEHVVTFECKDFLETGFPDDRFDVVWAQESILHTSQKRAVLKEVYRLLKPGGRLIVEDLFISRQPSSVKENRLLKSIYSNCLIPDLVTSEEFVASAAEAGFVEITMEDISARVKRSYRRLHNILSLASPLATLMRAMGLRSDTQARMMRGLLKQYEGVKWNLLLVGLCSARKV